MSSKSLQRILDFITSKESASEAVAQEKKRHVATRPAMMERYRELDLRCVDYAGKVVAAKAARSPFYLEYEAELRRLRDERDAVKAEWDRENQRLGRVLEDFNGLLVREFREFGLQKIASLSRAYREIQRGTHDDYVDRKDPISGGIYEARITVVDVETNGAAIEAAKERIITVMNAVSSVIASASLQELRTAIIGYVEEIENFELDVMRPHRVTLGTLLATKSDRRPDLVDGAAVAALSGRISKLEKGRK